MEGFKNGDASDHVEEPWHNWRRMAAYIYLAICVFDFVIMPSLTHINQLDTKEVLITLINQDNRELALQIMDRMKGGHWSPLTLIGGGLFHLAFGAILTGAAVTKGFERQEVVRQNGNSKQKKEHHAQPDRKGHGKKHREITEDEEWDDSA